MHDTIDVMTVWVWRQVAVVFQYVLLYLDVFLFFINNNMLMLCTVLLYGKCTLHLKLAKQRKLIPVVHH